MQSRIIALALLCLTPFFSTVQADCLSDFPLSWEQLKEKAREDNKPVLLLLHQEQSSMSKKLKQKTWDSPELKEWMEGKFLMALIDCAHAKKDEKDILNKFPASDQPVLIIFHADGHMIGRVDGFVQMETLKKILFRHLQRMGIQPLEKPLTLALAPVPDSPHALSSRYFGMTRGGSLPSHSSDLILSLPQTGIPGLQAIKLDSSHQFGLRLAAIEKESKLIKSYKKLSKFWRKDIYAFAEKNGEQTSYYLLLAPFGTPQQAQTISKGLEEFQQTETKIVSLKQLIH
ncbi:MAG: thioredoxin family protein [Bacteroidota bacterium]